MRKRQNYPQDHVAKKKVSAFQVTEECELMKFLLTHIKDKNRNGFKTLLKYKKVKVDDRAVMQYNYILKPGQKVEVFWDKEESPQKLSGIQILYEDRDIIVINKPAGILSVATERENTHTAYSILDEHVKRQFKNNKIYVVHRLDRETSGIMMYAKNHDFKKQIKDDWYNNVLERTYIAVVEGSIKPPAGEITSWLKENKDLVVYSSPDHEGKKAVTHYKTIKRNDRYSLLKIELETGRRNQIRVHMHDKDCPIAGDEKYGAQTDPMGRMGLHALILAFKHPWTNKVLRFESEIPGKFTDLFREN